LESGLANGKGLYPHLVNYFPTLVAKEYSNLLDDHRLKNEIILTVVINKVINTMGPVFHIRMHNLTDASYAQICRAYLISAELLDTDGLLTAIHELDNKVSSQIQYEAISALTKVVRANVVWLLNNKTELDVSDAIEGYRAKYNEVKACVQQQSSEGLNYKTTRLSEQGLPQELAEKIALATSLYHTLDVIAITEKSQSDTSDTLAIYLSISQNLDIRWLSLKINALEVTNAWHASAKFKLQNQLRAVHSLLAEQAITLGSAEQLNQSYAGKTERLQAMMLSVKEDEQVDFATLHVIVGELESLI